MLAILGVTGVAGCKLEKPFARTNPLDPENTLTFTLVGPDSSHAIGAVLTYALSSDPPQPLAEYNSTWLAYSDSVHFVTGDVYIADAVVPTGDGIFLVTNASLRYRRHTAVVRFHLREVGYTVLTGQKAVTLELSCAPWSQPANDCAAPLEVGSLISVHPRGTDAGGHPLHEFQFGLQRAQVTFRTPGIVTQEQGGSTMLPHVRLRGVGAGSTWVVVRMDEATDSVLVTVVP